MKKEQNQVPEKVKERRQKSKKLVKNWLGLVTALSYQLSCVKAVRRITQYRLKDVKIANLVKNEIDTHPSLTVIGRTYDAELYSIPSDDVSKASALQFFDLESKKFENTVFWKGIYLSPNHMILGLFNQIAGKMGYSLMKSNPQEPLKFTQIQKSEEVVRKGSDTLSDIIAMETGIGDSKQDRLVIVYDGAFQILRFHHKNQKITSFGQSGFYTHKDEKMQIQDLIILPAEEAIYAIGGLGYKMTDEDKESGFEAATFKINFSAKGDGFEEITSIEAKEGQWKGWKAPYPAFSNHGIVYSRENSMEENFFSRHFYYRAGRYVAVQRLGESGGLQEEYFLDTQMMNYRIRGVPATNLFGVLSSTKGLYYTDEADWDTERMAFNLTIFLYGISFGEGGSQGSKMGFVLVYSQIYRESPLGSDLQILRDLRFVVAGHWSKNTNLAAGANFLDICENTGDIGVLDAELKPQCSPETDILSRELYKGCLKVYPVIGGCHQCQRGYRLVKRPAELGRTAPSTQLCLEVTCLAPKYLNSKGDACFDCSQRVDHCQRCEEGSNACQSCQEGFKLALGNTTCHDCKNLEYLAKDVSTGERYCWRCDSLPKTNEYCSECDVETGKCLSCINGFRLDNTGFCRKECGLEEFWRGEGNNTCASCHSKVENCQKCLDLTGQCTSCVSGFRLLDNDTLCAPLCPENAFLRIEKSQKVALASCVNCSDLAQNGAGCTRCEILSGACEACSDGYSLTYDKFCKKLCSAEKEFWTGRAENKCSKCFEKCLRCADGSGGCLECDFGFEFTDETKTECAPYFPEKEMNGVESRARLLARYFDKLLGGVVLVFDRGVTNETIPANLENLDVMVFEADRQTALEVSSEVYEPLKRRKIVKLKLELYSLQGAKMRLSSKIRTQGGSDRRLLGNSSTRMFTTILEKVFYYKTSNLALYKTLGRILSLTLKFLAPAVFLVSLPSALAVLTANQTLGLLRLVGVDHPSNLLAFTSPFQQNAFTILTHLIPPSGSHADCHMDQALFRTDFSCIGFENTGGALLVLGVLLVGNVFMKMCCLPVLWEDWEWKRQNWLQKAFSNRTLHLFLLMTQKDFLMAAMVALNSRRLDRLVLDSAIQGVVILLYFCHFGCLLMVHCFGGGNQDSGDSEDSEEEIESKYKFPALEIDAEEVRDHIKHPKSKKIEKTQNWQKSAKREVSKHYYLILIFMLNTATPAVLNFAPEQPKMVMLAICGMNALMALYLVCFTPNKSKRLNIIDFVVYLSTSMIYGVGSAIRSLPKPKTGSTDTAVLRDYSMSEKDNFEYLGNSVVILGFILCAVVILNAVIGLLEMVYYMAKKSDSEPVGSSGDNQEGSEKESGRESELPVSEMDEEVDIFGILKQRRLRMQQAGEGSKKDFVVFGDEQRVPYKSEVKFFVSNVEDCSRWGQNLDFGLGGDGKAESKEGDKESSKNTQAVNIESEKANIVLGSDPEGDLGEFFANGQKPLKSILKVKKRIEFDRDVDRGDEESSFMDRR